MSILAKFVVKCEHKSIFDEKGRACSSPLTMELVGKVLTEEFGLLLPDFVGEVADFAVEAVDEAVGIGAVGAPGLESVFVIFVQVGSARNGHVKTPF